MTPQLLHNSPAKVILSGRLTMFQEWPRVPVTRPSLEGRQMHKQTSESEPNHIVNQATDILHSLYRTKPALTRPMLQAAFAFLNFSRNVQRVAPELAVEKRPD